MYFKWNELPCVWLGLAIGSRTDLRSVRITTALRAYGVLELVRNLVEHGDARERKWRGNWRMEWVASTLTPPPNVVYPALLKLMRTSRLPAVDWTDAPHRFKWTRPFRGKMKSGFCACAITFRTSYTQRWFLVGYRRFGTPYRPRLQLSHSSVFACWNVWPLTMRPVAKLPIHAA